MCRKDSLETGLVWGQEARLVDKWVPERSCKGRGCVEDFGEKVEVIPRVGVAGAERSGLGTRRWPRQWPLPLQ